MFTHLHVHTEYSMLDGLSRLEPLVNKAKNLGMESLAITDHGGMYGAIDFYRLAKQAGIKPIIGCETYVANKSRHTKDATEKSPYHMTLLAKDEGGYKNLVKLISRSHLEGFYYKPRVDRELLERYHEGLIVMTGCPSGEVPKAISEGRKEDARKTARWYKELFGEDYYFELMNHGDVPELPAINKGLMELHKELEIPVVATNDSHYTERESAPLQDILICIHTNTNIHDESRLRMSEDSYYLKSPEEMEALFPETPEAIANTQAIADKCNLDIDFSQLRLPLYRLPEGVTADEYLSDLCYEGLKRRMERITPEAEERLAYELEVIRHTQYANYFLVVWDIARFVRERDIFFAVRGSAAASLVLFCLGITNVNPLPYKLVFERFLNIERKEMPDIDMDFQDDRREEVINYVVDKYGHEHVAQIITFGTLGAKASLRDVGRALGMPYSDVDRVAKLVPFKLHITLDEALELNPEFKEVYEADSTIKNLVDTSRELEGLTRHSSTHAAGVVISEEPLDDFVPLQKPIKGDDDSVAMTQYTMEPCAALGLLKMDFLGLVNLSILAKTRDLVRENYGLDLELTEIPLEDQQAFELLSRGDTVGVFQLEGAGMTRYIKELKPSSLGDVAAMIALYRPGPMEHIGTFIDAKHGRIEPHYPHPALREILEETYGVIVYQDQVLHIARTFAGYTLGEADIVRKAMGKKIPEIMAKEREKFVQGALEQGYTQEMADAVFALVEPFAGYAFNKAHSVSYGLISYWTAYFKAHYPAEYMTSLLNSYMGNTEKIVTSVAECRRLSIPVLPPDINNGKAEFSIETGIDGQKAIRFGMAAVKNVGSGAIAALIEARDKVGGFQSLEQMCKDADLGGLNRKTLESLVRVGAFDEFGDRGAILNVVEKILSLAHSEARMRDSNQTSMFDVLGDSMPSELATITLPAIETSEMDRGTWEAELLGVALSNTNALNNLLANAGRDTIVFHRDLEPDMAGSKVKVAGQVSSVSQRYTRDQRPFTIASLSLIDGAVEVLVWEDALKETQGLWEEGKLVTVTGTVRVRDDQINISCSAAVPFEAQGEDSPELNDDVEPQAAAVGGRESAVLSNGAAISNGAPNGTNGNGNGKHNGNGAVQQAPPPDATQSLRRLSLRIRDTGNPSDDQYVLDDIKRLLLEHQGQDEVYLEIAASGRVVVMEWPQVRVKACSELEEELSSALVENGGYVRLENTR